MATSTKKKLFLTGLSFLLFVLPAPADAQAPEPAESLSVGTQDRLARAKDLFREGVALYQAGELLLACDSFRRSRELYPSVKNTVNAALCLEKLGQFDEALNLYEEVISKHAFEADQANLEAIRTAMAALRSKIGSVTVSYNVPGDVVIDGRLRGTLPLSAPLRVLPGTRSVRVFKEGYKTYEARISVKPGQTVNVDARLEALTARESPATESEQPAPAPPVPVPVSSEHVDRPTSWRTYTAFGVGALGLAVGTVFGVVTLSRASSIKEDCRNDTCPTSRKDDGESADRYAQISDVSFGIGAIGLGVGLYGLLSADSPAKSRATGRTDREYISPVVGLGSIGVEGAF